MYNPVRFYKAKQFCDNRGRLSVLSLQNDVPFKVARTFWITDIPDNAVRGCHAHKTCHELIFVLKGQTRITIDDLDITLKDSDDGIIVWAGEWCELHDFKPNTVLLILASEEYDASGYIHNHEEYINWQHQQILD